MIIIPRFSSSMKINLREKQNISDSRLQIVIRVSIRETYTNLYKDWRETDDFSFIPRDNSYQWIINREKEETKGKKYNERYRHLRNANAKTVSVGNNNHSELFSQLDDEPVRLVPI